MNLLSNSYQLFLLLLPKCLSILPLYIFNGIYSCHPIWDTGAQILDLWHFITYIWTFMNLFSNSCQPFLLLLLKYIFILPLYIFDRIYSCYPVCDTTAQIFDLWQLVIYLLTSMNLLSNSCQPFLLLLLKCPFILLICICNRICSSCLVWDTRALILVLSHPIINFLTSMNLLSNSCHPFLPLLRKALLYFY